MEKDIGKIPKNPTTDVIIRLDDFGGRKGVTIREFVTSERYTGFTKSGVKIQAADFKKFKDMVNSVSEEDLKKEAGAGLKEAGKESPKEKLPKNQATLDEEMPDRKHYRAQLGELRFGKLGEPVPMEHFYKILGRP